MKLLGILLAMLGNASLQLASHISSTATCSYSFDFPVAVWSEKTAFPCLPGLRHLFSIVCMLDQQRPLLSETGACLQKQEGVVGLYFTAYIDQKYNPL